jgi:hypothetical protein
VPARQAWGLKDEVVLLGAPDGDRLALPDDALLHDLPALDLANAQDLRALRRDLDGLHGHRHGAGPRSALRLFWRLL